MKTIFFLLIVGLVGCKTSRWAERSLDHISRNHEAELATKCNEKYPPKLDTTTTVKYLTVKCPPLPESKGDSGKIIEPTPPKKVIKSVEPSKEKKETSQTVVLNHGEEIDVPIETIQPTIQSTSALTACEENAKLERDKWSKKVQKQTNLKNIFIGITSGLSLILFALLYFIFRLLKRKTK